MYIGGLINNKVSINISTLASIHKRVLSHALLALVLTTATTIAPKVQAEDDNILQDLLEAAQRNDDQLLTARAQFDAARSAAAENLGPVLPQLRLNFQGFYTDNDCIDCSAFDTRPNQGSVTTGLELTQTIFEPTKWRAYTSARSRAAMAGYQFGAANLDLFQRLLDQYLNILTETDNLRTLISQRDRLTRQLQITSERVIVGTRSVVDRTEISSNLALIESQISLSRITLQSFYEGLSASLRLNIRNLPPVRQDLELPALENDDPQYWVDLALEQNPGLLAARAARDAARQNLKIRQARHSPTLDFVASYSHTYTDVIGQGSGFSADSNSLQARVGVRLNVPLSQGGAVYSGVRTGRAELEQAERRVNLAEIEITTLVPVAVRRVAQGEALIAASREALEARQGVVEQTELRFNANSASITDLLLAYERLAETERSYYNALYAHIRNYADLYVRTAFLDEDSVVAFYDIADMTDYDPDLIPYLETEEPQSN